MSDNNKQNKDLPKEEANKIEYTYIEQTYTTNITEEKET